MYKAKVEEQVFEFDFSDEKSLKGTVNGTSFEMDLARKGSVRHVIHKHKSYTIEIVHFNKEEKTCVLLVNNQEVSVSIEDRFDALLHSLGMDNMNSQKVNEVKAPMPGLVLKIMVEPEQKVSKGDGLLVLEAMKMETEVRASDGGVVSALAVREGDAVKVRDTLLRL